MHGPMVQTATVILEIVKALGAGGVLAVLLGSTGLGGAITAFLAWKKAPVEKKDADIAAAEVSQGMSLELAQELRAEINRLREEMGELRTELRGETQQRRALGEEVQAYKGTIYRLRVALSRAAEAFEYVTNHWTTLRENETPPMFPVLTLDD